MTAKAFKDHTPSKLQTILQMRLLRTGWHVFSCHSWPQVVDCAQRWGADEAHQLIFNRQPEVSWEQKIRHCEVMHEDVMVHVRGA